MKPFAVICYPENTMRDMWFRAVGLDGRPGRGRDVCTFFAEEKSTDNAYEVTTTFFDNEPDADSWMEEVLRINPGKLYVKMKALEAARVSVGPIQKAVVSDAGLLPF